METVELLERLNRTIQGYVGTPIWFIGNQIACAVLLACMLRVAHFLLPRCLLQNYGRIRIREWTFKVVSFTTWVVEFLDLHERMSSTRSCVRGYSIEMAVLENVSFSKSSSEGLSRGYLQRGRPAQIRKIAKPRLAQSLKLAPRTIAQTSSTSNK